MLQKLPDYTYVPGLTPHPVSDPRGHWHGIERPQLTIADGLKWGCELYSAGYYWEAHEVWEGVWMELGRVGLRADLVKGLIKLAAAGVKVLEGNERGATRHFQRAGELLEQGEIAAADWPEWRDLLDVAVLREIAAEQRRRPPQASDEDRASARCGGVPILGSVQRTSAD